MQRWAIITLLASAVLVALGVALNTGAPGSSLYSLPLLVLGVSASAVWVVMWGARTLGLGQKLADAGPDPATLRDLLSELTECAQQAETRGVLTLADAHITCRPELFKAGVSLVIGGEDPTGLRRKLQEVADAESADATNAAERTRIVCRVCTAVALGGALVPVLWLVGTGLGARQVGGVAAFGVLAAVYGSFAIAALAGEIARRAAADVSRWEIEGSLIIEALAAVRAGQSSQHVAGLLSRLVEPGAAEPQTDNLRRAA